MIDVDAIDFIERCQSHKSAQALLTDLLACVGSLGFHHLILSGVPVGGQKLAPMVELMGWPEGWFERYIEQDYKDSDAVCIWSAKTLKPFSWADIPQRWADTSINRTVQGDASAFGIRSGFAIPMLSTNHWQSVLSFASDSASLELSPRQKSLLVTMAVFAGMSVQALQELDKDINLTDREAEVLLWAAAGKSAWETSEIMGLSEATVWKHQSKAREKFGVATTVQAVVESIRLRLIFP